MQRWLIAQKISIFSRLSIKTNKAENNAWAQVSATTQTNDFYSIDDELKGREFKILFTRNDTLG